MATMESPEIEKGGLEIILPADKRRVKQLQLKLAEYKERARRHEFEALQQGKNIAYAQPETVLDFSTKSKIEVLSALLEKGKISWREIEESNSSPAKIPYLRDAFEIVRSYAESGGKELVGGTGLPEVEEDK